MLADVEDNELGVWRLALLGEMGLVAAFREVELDLLEPVAQMPPQLASAKPLCEGEAAYWSPHLPALDHAMGGLLYKLLLLRGTLSPAAIITRGVESVVFLKSGRVPLWQVRTTRMPRAAQTSTRVSRYAATVDPAGQPVQDPNPDWAKPLPAPATR